MSTSNVELKPRLSNHMAAPVSAVFVAAMRHAFGKVEVTYVDEGSVQLGRKIEVVDLELISYTRWRAVKGKTVYSNVSFTLARVAA